MSSATCTCSASEPAVPTAARVAQTLNVDGGNGVYAYGGSTLFPSNSYRSTNYWVDVVFTDSLVA